MHRTTALAFGLLLAFPTAVAAPSTVLIASSVRAVGPDPGLATGSLDAFLLDDGIQVEQSPPVPPFSIEARSLHIETDYADLGVRAGIGVSSPYSTVSEDHADAQVEEAASRPGYQVDVLPAVGWQRATVTVSDGCFEAGATDRSHMEPHDAHLSVDRSPLEADLGQAVQVVACGPDTLQVTGTFRVHLWQTDVLLRQQGQSRTLQSGHLPSASEGAPVQAGREQEIYMEIRNGTLRTSLTAEGRLYVRGMQAAIDGSVVLTHARGRLATGSRDVALDDQTLQLRGGPLQVALAGHGTDPMQVTLEGAWREASLGDVTLGPAAAQAPAVAAPFALALVALAAWRRRQGPDALH
ncbi:MAG: hypothetical protein ABR562_02630 [Thermoplasmatota archaeon]